MNIKYVSRNGFTLMELMVVIIIIAVLAAIAVPQYKHAALKSRFSTVMPMAKSIADAQEVYYQGRQMYALSQEELDVTPVTAENTSVSLSTEGEENKYAYVAAQRSDVPGARYIMYQKYSPKFAGNIHCEAAVNNEDALWLCEKGLRGQEIDGSLQGDEYKTYLLEGNAENANDYFAQACESGGEQKECDCGEAVSGSCNDKTGLWEYATDCPQPLEDDVEECQEGYTGGRVRHGNVCTNGAYTYGNWEGSCNPTWTAASLNALANQLCAGKTNYCKTYIHNNTGKVGVCDSGYRGNPVNLSENQCKEYYTMSYMLYDADGFKTYDSRCSSWYNYCTDMYNKSYNRDGSWQEQHLSCGPQQTSGYGEVRMSGNSFYCTTGFSASGSTSITKYDANNNVIETRKALCSNYSGSWYEQCTATPKGNATWSIQVTANGKTTTKTCPGAINIETMDCVE